MSSTTLSVTLAHAIAFLTGPLLSSYDRATISKLHNVLEANLTALYAPTWSSKEPLRGSARRILTLSPACLPPRSIYSACVAAGVQWFGWINSLGGKEFDFYVDPGCVSIRYAARPGVPAQMITIWAGEVVAPALPTPRTGLASFTDAQNTAIKTGIFDKTLAQQLLEEDDEEDKLFNMIADEISTPAWATPVYSAPNRSSSPLSSISSSSRCSSRSSNSSSSSFSVDAASTTSSSSSTSYRSADQKQRREKPKTSRVFVDNSKTEVTPYDGGKTTVLTGGVMLGGGPKAQKPKSSGPSSGSWRSRA